MVTAGLVDRALDALGAPHYGPCGALGHHVTCQAAADATEMAMGDEEGGQGRPVIPDPRVF